MLLSTLSSSYINLGQGSWCPTAQLSMQVLWLWLNQNHSSCALIFQENMAWVRPIRAAHLMDAAMGPDQKAYQPIRGTFRTSIRCCFMCSSVWIALSIGWGWGVWDSFRDVKYKRYCSHLYHQVRMRSARMQTPLEEGTENTQEWGYALLDLWTKVPLL